MSWFVKSQIPLNWPNHCMPGSADGKPGHEWPSGGQYSVSPHLRVPKIQQVKTHPCTAKEGSCSKDFVSWRCGEEMSFLPLKLSLTCFCTGLLMSLPIRNHTLLFCSSCCSNNLYSLTTCTSQNHPSPNFKSSLYLFRVSSLPSSVAIASHQASLSPSVE